MTDLENSWKTIGINKMLSVFFLCAYIAMIRLF